MIALPEEPSDTETRLAQFPKEAVQVVRAICCPPTHNLYFYLPELQPTSAEAIAKVPRCEVEAASLCSVWPLASDVELRHVNIIASRADALHIGLHSYERDLTEHRDLDQGVDSGPHEVETLAEHIGHVRVPGGLHSAS